MVDHFERYHSPRFGHNAPIIVDFIFYADVNIGGLSAIRPSSIYLFNPAELYIRGITSGRALPSLGELFNICAYFNMTPADFFAPLAAEDTSLAKLNK